MLQKFGEAMTHELRGEGRIEPSGRTPNEPMAIEDSQREQIDLRNGMTQAEKSLDGSVQVTPLNTPIQSTQLEQGLSRPREDAQRQQEQIVSQISFGVSPEATRAREQEQQRLHAQGGEWSGKLCLQVQEAEEHALDDVEQPNVELDVHRDGNQHYVGNDKVVVVEEEEEEELQRELREVDQQMRSAADVAGEVYDDSLHSKEHGGGGGGGAGGGGGGNGDVDTTRRPQNTTPLFPDGPVEPPAKGKRAVARATETEILHEAQSDTMDGSTSRRDKRKPMYNGEYGEYVDPNSPSEIEAPRLHIEGPPDVLVSVDSVARSSIRQTSKLFPGPSFDPREPKQAPTAEPSSQVAHDASPEPIYESRKNDRTPLPNIPDQTSNGNVTDPPEHSRRRKLEHETETDIHIKAPTENSFAQFTDWESPKDLVASIESIWDKLEHTRIYVAGTVDIEELNSRRDSNHKLLWSWSENEKDQFKSQIGPLLREKDFDCKWSARIATLFPGNIIQCLKRDTGSLTMSSTAWCIGWQSCLRSPKNVSGGIS